MENNIQIFGWNFALSYSGKQFSMQVLPKLVNHGFCEGLCRDISFNQQLLVVTEEGDLIKCIEPFLKVEEMKISTSKIHQLATGGYHYLILLENGSIISFSTNRYGMNSGQLGRPTLHNQLGVPSVIDYFKGQEVGSLYCGLLHSFVLTKNGDLYSFGSNTFGEIGRTDEENVQPKVIAQSVQKVYTGFARHSFFLTTGNQLFGFGYNKFSQIGISNTENQNCIQTPTHLPLFDDLEIVDISLTLSSTLVLLPGGKLLIAGKKELNGINEQLNQFSEIEFFKNKIVNKIASSHKYSIVHTAENKFYVFGEKGYYPLGKNSQLMNETKYQIRPGHAIEKIRCSAFTYTGFIKVKLAALNQDLYNFWKRNEFTDFKIKGFKCHLSLLEARTGKSAKEILKTLEEYSNQEIEKFLKWVYSDQLLDTKLIQQFENDFQINDLVNKDLQSDLGALYKTENKDFRIQAKQESFPIHKFLLQARSEIIRGMFLSVKNTGNQITDYTKKPERLLKLFIKFLYTDNLKIEKLDSSEKSDMIDIFDFYQINNDSPYYDQLLAF
ncbi:btk-binding protein-related [Anaeramoeba flamelloides]|uniref:Btk-binding protein-related n=1 Tax=Anaeramoeba flamelloides TaxID=1746091 RepID=A0ABQ8XEY5_9EUKA|nr:btk-binding protein-related [Anaeramoeba flamelloides]